jgi:hypothetical protein
VQALIRGVLSTGSEGRFVFRGCHRASMVRHHPYRHSGAGAGQRVPRVGEEMTNEPGNSFQGKLESPEVARDMI